MRFINKTKNSVQLEDIKTTISYNDELPQEIDTQSIKKSFAFQQMVSMGAFDVLDASSDRIEQNLFKLSKNYKKNEDPAILRVPSGNKVEVILRGHFYEASGYSKVNRNLAISLHRQGFSVEIDPISTKNNDMNELEAKIFSMLRKPVGKDAILIDSVIPTQGKPIKNNYNILYTTAECINVPKQFVDTANCYDEVWVTSKFSKKSFEDSGCSKKITVVNPIINKIIYNENVLPHSFRPSVKSFVFLSVSSWGYRKGNDALLKAYQQAFTKNDDVSLVLLISEKSKTSQKQILEDIRKLQVPDGPHIAICMKSIPEYQLPSFYKSCHAFVLPSRGEGFGLPCCEASLCGLPVISTNYGGQLDFLDHNNSTLVDIDSLEIAKDTGIHYWDGQYFPSLKSESFISDLSSSMRYVYLNYNKAVEKNKLLQNKIIETLGGETIGYQTKNILTPIWDLKRERKYDSSFKYIKQNSYNL